MAFDAANTYCSVDDLTARVSRDGKVWAGDVDDADGDVDTVEDIYHEAAIDYANGLADEALTPHVDISPRPANDWIRDRVIDIAAARFFSLGGRAVPAPFKEAADESKDKLEQVREGLVKVPGLDYTQTLSSGRRSGLPIRVVNLPRCCR